MFRKMILKMTVISIMVIAALIYGANKSYEKDTMGKPYEVYSKCNLDKGALKDLKNLGYEEGGIIDVLEKDCNLPDELIYERVSDSNLKHEERLLRRLGYKTLYHIKYNDGKEEIKGVK